MPKSTHTNSPPQSAHSKSAKPPRDPDDSSMRLSETAMRKKKNADAQAAFRARRANYIATLEETVTSLENVVVELQDSCREARREAAHYRQESGRLSNALEALKHENREREKYLRALWHARKGSNQPTVDDFPPPPVSFASVTNPDAASSSFSAVHVPHTHPYASPFGDNARYSMHDDSLSTLDTGTYNTGTSSPYGDRSPALSFVKHEGDAGGTGRLFDPHRMAQLNQYAVYNLQGCPSRDAVWQPGVGQSTLSTGDSSHPESSGSSHSPAFMESPTATSIEMPYVPRMRMMDNQKSTLSNIDAAPYVFADNGSLSPISSGSHAGSSTSVSSSFQFVFPSEGQERVDAEYRRHTTHGAELTLHGGTADVSSYGLASRRANTVPERPMLGSTPSFGASDSERPRTERDRSEGSAPYLHTRRSRRHAADSAASPSSRSPSPGAQAPISSTLAVIKAQAFGALRRTRPRPKKSSDSAAKAIEALEARGVKLGLGHGAGSAQKRPRLHSDDDAMQS